MLSDCILSTQRPRPDGYCMFKKMGHHRFVWVEAFGPIPEGHAVPCVELSLGPTSLVAGAALELLLAFFSRRLPDYPGSLREKTDPKASPPRWGTR